MRCNVLSVCHGERKKKRAMSGWTDRAHRQTTEAAAAERGGMADGGGTSDPMAAVSAPPPRSWSSSPLLRSPPRRRRSKRPIPGGRRTRMHLFPFPWTDGYAYACIPRRCRTSSEVRNRAHAANLYLSVHGHLPAKFVPRSCPFKSSVKWISCKSN